MEGCSRNLGDFLTRNGKIDKYALFDLPPRLVHQPEQSLSDAVLHVLCGHLPQPGMGFLDLCPIICVTLSAKAGWRAMKWSQTSMFQASTTLSATAVAVAG